MDEYVHLPNGFSISKQFLYYIHDLLTSLKSTDGLLFWQIVHHARHPNDKLPDYAAGKLSALGLLGGDLFLHYTNHLAILYLVEGRGRSINVIPLAQLEAMILANTP